MSQWRSTMTAVCSGVASGAFGATGGVGVAFSGPGAGAGAAGAAGWATGAAVLGVGASASINLRRVHLAFALMYSTMRRMFSDTGVVSISRYWGGATLTWVTVLLTLKNCRPCCASCWLNLVATGSGNAFCWSHSWRIKRWMPVHFKV